MLRLQDTNQPPLSGVSLGLGLDDGVLSGPIEEDDQDGAYQAPTRWNEGEGRVEAKARVDDAFELVAGVAGLTRRRSRREAGGRGAP